MAQVNIDASQQRRKSVLTQVSIETIQKAQHQSNVFSLKMTQVSFVLATFDAPDQREAEVKARILKDSTTRLQQRLQELSDFDEISLRDVDWFAAYLRVYAVSSAEVDLSLGEPSYTDTEAEARGARVRMRRNERERLLIVIRDHEERNKRIQMEIKEAEACTHEKIRREVVPRILDTPLMKTVVCPCCACINPPVTFKFPCYLTDDARTCRPMCSAPLCVKCACRITGLTKHPSERDAKCTICRTSYGAYECASSAYTMNMLAIQMVDTVLEEENKEFMKHFGVPLNPIECTDCTSTFAGLSALHDHMVSLHPEELSYVPSVVLG